jgi:hypothetical protein
MTSGVTDPALALDGDVNAEPEPPGAGEQKPALLPFASLERPGGAAGVLPLSPESTRGIQSGAWTAAQAPVRRRVLIPAAAGRAKLI